MRVETQQILVASPQWNFGNAEKNYFDEGYSVVVASNSSDQKSLSQRLKIDFPTAFKVLEQVKLENPRVIYATNEAIGLPLALLKRIGFLQQQKLVIYNQNALSFGPWGLKRVLTELGSWDKMVCLGSDEELDFLLKYKVSRKKVTFNPLAYNVTSFIPKEEEDKINRYALSVGVSKRDYCTLLEAAKRLVGTNFKLLVDPSSPSDPLRDKGWKEGLPLNTLKVSYPEPSSFTNAVELALFVSLAIDPDSIQKSAGCTLVQAGASAGIPSVVASSGLHEYIIDGITGIIVKPGDPKVLAEALKEMWNNCKKRIRMGKTARDFAEANFSEIAHKRRLRKILEEV